MNKILLPIAALLLWSLAFLIQAQPPLSKTLITSFQKITQQWQNIEQKYPDIFAQMDKIDMSKKDELIDFIKNSSAASEMETILNKNGFDNFDDFYDVTLRVMGGMMAVQMEQMPAGMNLDSALSMYENSIEQMKKNNAPASMIKEMEQKFAEQKSELEAMKAAMEKASDADKKFVRENKDWVMSTFGDQ